ncbi:hypothetical protein GE061_016967 [Apolygus lucorum]|uniref:Uncharacterized protein n=1 Tax=Apolygus lucorum TaxID=248454 RepID=A0A8S9XIS5_APOLU|nr:hypothetical protein GE061_016967 [Apolygus lucorum]
MGDLSESVMSSSTSHSEDNGRVEKGPTGKLKKTIPKKTSATEESTSRKDDEKTTFRGPDGRAKLFTKNELKKLQIHIEIKKSEAASTPPAVPFDPNLIAPVRRPGEGRAPLFSRLPTVNEDEDNAKKEKLDIEKKKEKSHSSGTRSKSRSSEESTSRKDDEKTTFRGPDGRAKLFTKNEFKKLQIHNEIKKPEAASTPPAVPFDPNLIAPVRRPDKVEEKEGPHYSRDYLQSMKTKIMLRRKNWISKRRRRNPTPLGHDPSQDPAKVAEVRA